MKDVMKTYSNVLLRTVKKAQNVQLRSLFNIYTPDKLKTNFFFITEQPT